MRKLKRRIPPEIKAARKAEREALMKKKIDALHIKMSVISDNDWKLKRNVEIAPIVGLNHGDVARYRHVFKKPQKLRTS